MQINAYYIKCSKYAGIFRKLNMKEDNLILIEIGF